MVTKGIVESVNEYKATVRLPIFDGIESVKNSTLTVDLSEAPICTLPNASNIVSEGDIVYVAFEDNDIGQPVIIGHLYKESGTETKINLDLGSLTTSLTSKLSDQTYIGNVSPNEIKSLSGIKANIQNQISLLSDKLTTTQDSVNSELNSLSSNISQVDSDYNNMSLSLAVEEVSTGNKLTVTLSNVDGQLIDSQTILIPVAEVLSDVEYTQNGYIEWLDNSNFNSTYTYYTYDSGGDNYTSLESTPANGSDSIYYVKGDESSLILWFTTYDDINDINVITFTSIPITDLIASLQSELNALEEKLANYNTGDKLTDDNFVHKTLDEIINGVKTFTETIQGNAATSSQVYQAIDESTNKDIPLLFSLDTAAGNSNVYKAPASLYYNPKTETFYAPNISTDGSITYEQKDEITTASAFIYLRENSETELKTGDYSGVAVTNYDGEGTYFYIVVDSDGTAKIGDVTLDEDSETIAESNLQPIATRADSMIEDAVIYWDATNSMLNNDHNYLTLNDGVNNRTFLYLYDDGDSNNYGSELVISGLGNTFIGAGESAVDLRKALQSSVGTGEVYGKNSEYLYLASDNSIYFYSRANTIANRLGIVYDTSGYLRPLVTDTRQLGSEDYYWNSAYVNNIYGNLTGTATNATADASGNEISDYYVTRSTAQEISGSKTFSGTANIISGTFTVTGTLII